MQRGAWAAAGVMALGVGLAGCPEHPYKAHAPPATTLAAEPVTSAPVAAPSGSGEAGPAGSAWAELPASVRPSEGETMAALGASSVLSSQPARRVLYTWTSEEQAQKLRADRVLLVKGSNDGGDMSQFATSLWDSYATDPWARVLMNPPFHRMRYAWPSPWATRLSPDAHPYGDVLVRVELKPEAIVASYTPALPLASRWAFHGLDGRVIPSREALAAAGRIGAIYHVHEREDLGMREYVICNESMVASWSLATDEIKATIESDLRTIDLLTRFTRRRFGWDDGPSPAQFSLWLRETTSVWSATTRPASVESAYAASLAFASHQYQPAEGSLIVLAIEMRTAATKLATQSPPLVHQPAATPPARVRVPTLVPPPPRTQCVTQGTFGCFTPANLPCRDDSGKITLCKR